MSQTVLDNPTNLEEAINYHEGSVVSREIFKNNNGSATLFAFDKNQGLSAHKTPYEALVYVLDGEIKITIDNKENKLKRGDMIHMPANVTHALKSEKQFKMLLIMIKSA
ncbi:MAG: cupin domain-containing protein [Candidatus Roizmanbacteria bacterium]|nr:MAG: cupin domain-containing protein [Candidatus Roizmanbacteria bacterium]